MWTRRKPAVSVSPGFLLLLGLMLYLDDGVGLLPWVLLAGGFHELGHMAAARLMGGRAEHLSLTAVGAELRFSYPTLSYGSENLVALAGPAANLLIGVPALWADAWLPAAANLGLALFNLLPVMPLDGGRVLFNLTAEGFGPAAADCVTAVAAGVLAGVLAGFGVIAAIHYANFTLLLTAVWLLSGILGREKRVDSGNCRSRKFFHKK